MRMPRALILALLLAATAILPAQEQLERVRLWVRGDDFGYTHASNMALEKGFAEGVMQSASVLVPGPWFKETADILRRHPEWSVGVHLTITSEWNTLRWPPVSPAHEVPSLVAPDGFLWGNGYYRPRPPGNDFSSPWASRPPQPVEVEREFRAQIEHAKAAGLRLDYIDCHMGFACSDALLPITQKLAKEYCLAISGPATFDLQRIRVAWDARTPEEGKRLLSEELRKLTPGLWLYVDHPAADSPELRAVDTVVGERWARERSSVLATWTDPTIRDLIAQLGIELVSPRDLFDYSTCRPK